MRSLLGTFRIFSGSDGQPPWYAHVNMALASGSVLLDHSQRQLECTLLWRLVKSGGLQCLPDILFRQNEPWALEDLAQLDRWLIGAAAYKNDSFRKDLIDYLNPCQSQPFARMPLRKVTKLPQMLDMGIIVDQVGHCPDPALRKHFLEEILKYDDPVTLQPFIEAGFEVEERFGRCQPTPGTWLSYVARRRKPHNLRALLAAGADPLPAIPALLQHHPFCDGVSQDIYCQLLDALDSMKQPLSLDPDRCMDPFHFLYCSENTLAINPQSLLSRQLYRRESMYGAKDCPISRSYMFQAIWRGQHHLVEALLRHGVSSQQHIGDMFDCDGSLKQDPSPRLPQQESSMGLHSWLTFAIDHGSTACADILIRYGADITLQNSLGRNALQIAQLNLRQDHPRSSAWGFPQCTVCGRKGQRDKGIVSLKKDLETFDMLGMWATKHSLEHSLLLEICELPDQARTGQVAIAALDDDSGESTDLANPRKSFTDTSSAFLFESVFRP